MCACASTDCLCSHLLLGPLYSGTSLQSNHYWDHSTVVPLSSPTTTGTTLQWYLSPIQPLLGPLYSGTSLQSNHYWDHSTVVPLSSPTTTGPTLQWYLSPVQPLLGPLYIGTSLQSNHYWDHSTLVPLLCLTTKEYICIETLLCTACMCVHFSVVWL